MSWNWAGWVVLALMFLILAGLFIAGLIRQKHLDAPCKGLLIVDRQDFEGPCYVYLQTTVDPATFREGEEVKLKVRVVLPKTQQKQG